MPAQPSFLSSSLPMFLLLLLLLQWMHFGQCRRFSSDHDGLSCHPPLFVFGASMVDVGENAAAAPLRSAAEFSPYGVDYFHRPSARFSNGRLFIDFISQGLGYGLMDPFLNSVGSNFANGVNFASSGSTARNTSVQGDGQTSSGLFSLSIQVDQFRQFKSKVKKAQSRHAGRLKNVPSVHKFSDAIYFIETAHNDYLSTAFQTPDFNPNQAVATTIAAIAVALKELYDLGARNIIFMNVVPLGCTPAILAFFGDHDVDEDGCNVAYNDLVKLHNNNLEKLLKRLSSNLTSANLIVFDAYTLYLDAVRNPSKYGLKYPMQACCGAGRGKYNLIRGINCGSSGDVNGIVVEAKRCEDPSLYISWDGLHPVESFGRHLAEGVLSGSHLKPNFLIQHSCRHPHLRSSGKSKLH